LNIIFENESLFLKDQNKISTDTTLIIYLSKLKEQEAQKFNLDQYYASYRELLKRDLGLSYYFDAVQNINGFNGDLEDNILYKRRYLTGIDINFLRGGLLEAKTKINNLESQQLFEEQIEYYKRLNQNNNLKMNQCIFWFNTKKINLLERRKKLLNQQLPIIEELYFAKKINKEKVLKNQTRIAEVNGLNGVYSSYNQFIVPNFDSTLFEVEVPLFDLNYALLMNDFDEKKHVDSISAILLKQLDNQNKWYNDIKLKTYFRYNYYDLISTSQFSRSFFNVGININMPLPLTTKQQNNFDRQKIIKQSDGIEHSLEQKKIEILNLAYEFRYQLKQYIAFHQKSILNNEALRQERVKSKLQDADFNPIHALELIDEKFQIEIELLDLKQNLYLKLVNIQEMIPHVPIEKLIVPLNLPNYFDFEDEVIRNCYVWSKSFENHSVEFISEYIIYNQFDAIQLAVSLEDNTIEQKKLLIETLISKKIKIDLMIGQNELMNSNSYLSDLKKLIDPYSLTKINGIHLDIEPHTRADWKTNKEELKLKYLQLVKETKLFCQTNRIQLSIDVPLSIDSSFALELFKEVDIVRFMAYENVKEDYILRKMNAYKEFKNKSALALRTEDFTSRNELEEFAKKTMAKLDLKQLNLHDLNRLIEMDKKAMIEK
jgi:hypothetical protein